MEIVTITCDRDFHQTVLQSHSIDKFLIDTCIHWIVVESTNRPIEEWQLALSPHYTRHTLRLIESKQLIQVNHLPGYIRQQVAKLSIARLIDSSHYLLLDSKDVLIRNTKLSDWGSEEGNNLIYKPVTNTSLDNILAPELAPYLQFTNLCRKVLGADSPPWFWAPTTPFRCKTSNVKTLLSSIDVNRVFDPYITGIREVSEFLLYRFFSSFEVELSDVESGFWTSGNNTKFMWTNKSLDTDFQIFSNEFYKSVSFHRWYITNNGKRIEQIIRNLVATTGMEQSLVNAAFDITFWNNETRHERGLVVFDQLDCGYRLD